MIVHQAFRYELDPNNRQRTLFAKHAGAARFAWNWAIARRIERFQNNEGKARFTNAIEQHRQLNALKKSEFPWMYEVSKCAPQEALRDLDRAFKNFWRERKKGCNVSFPKFKKKGVDDSFRLNGSIRVTARAARLPRLGKIRTKEEIAVQGRILSATVKREADRWYVSLHVERTQPEPQPIKGPIVGVDFGLDCFAVLSDGSVIRSPKALATNLKLLKRRSKQHSHKQNGSNNKRKSASWLARLHRKIRNIRADAIHKFTTMLAKTKSVIVVEDLAVRNLIRNRYLARSIADAGWGEARRQLAYKTAWYGSTLVVAPKYFASTRMCSRCRSTGVRLGLGQRIFTCASCGLVVDRDLNAARNLENWYREFPGNLYACGEPSSGCNGQYESVYEEWLVEAGSKRCLSLWDKWVSFAERS